MRLTSVIVPFVLATALVSPSPAVAQRDVELQRFASWAEAEMAKDQMPGLSVAVLDDGELWAKGFGFADLENGVPATEKSSYRMASVTKPMTAVAALRLAEKGLLDLDAPIQKYVPYFPDKGAPITVRQLLAHLGGISHYRDYALEGRIREAKTTEESIAIFASFDLVAPPGERYSYSTYGYNLAGAALEAAAGKPYAALIRELVWDPAGMTGARMDDPRAIIPNRVDGYTLENGTLRRSEFVDVSSRFAGGGTRATVVDMVRFAAALDEGKLLDAKSLDAMWWPQATKAGRFIDYGLGWGIYSVNGHYQVSHTGSQPETRTLLVVLPRENLAIALASNFEDARLSKYRDRLYWHLTGEVWNPEKYATDRRDRLARQLADLTFDAGRFYFEKYGRAATTDRVELTRAFDAIRKLAGAIARGGDDADEAIAAALHPAAGQPLLIAGSYMAAKLAERDPARYYRLGELAFLEDYVALYRSDASIPRAYRLPRDLERRVVELSDGWEAIWTPETAAMTLDRADGTERLARSLREIRTPRILPNLSGALVESVESAFRRGDRARAAELASLAADLYPEDSESAGAQGVMLSLGRDPETGRAMLAKSVSLNARGYANPENLASIGRYASGAGMAEAAIALLENAATIHARDVAIRVALGDAYAAAGRTADARRAYESALAIDPESKEAREGLKKIAP